MVIWKYPLEVTDVQHILIPQDAQLLSVQVQVKHSDPVGIGG